MIESFKDKTIVFFGDSITDTCKMFHKDHPYGGGFVNMIKTELDVSYTSLNIKVYNEGIGGNKTEDLINRINDVTNKDPDLVFLLIGINDIWHLYDLNIVPNINEIINRIDLIINTLRNYNSKVVLLTPFLFPTNEHFAGLMPLFEKLTEALHIYVKEKEVDCIDTYLLMKKSNLLSLTKDSIHPTIYGHGILAQAVFEYLNK